MNCRQLVKELLQSPHPLHSSSSINFILHFSAFTKLAALLVVPSSQFWLYSASNCISPGTVSLETAPPPTYTALPYTRREQDITSSTTRLG